MLEQKFTEFANAQNCNYSVHNYKVDGALGSKIYISVHTFSLTHHDTDIAISYEFGNYNIAEFNFDLKPTREIPEFSIIAKEHFMRLFSFNKDSWQIKTEDAFMKAAIRDYLNRTGLTKLAKEVAFEPTIEGNYIDSKFNCNIKFYLGFDNKEESFLPVLEFCKVLIDKFNEKYCS